MKMTFCNRCGKPIDNEIWYRIIANHFLPDGRCAGEKQIDLCDACYKTIDVSHRKTKVLEDAIKWLNKK